MVQMFHGLSRYDYLVKECLNAHALNDSAPFPQVFGRLFHENPVTGNLSTSHIVDAFDALVETMRTDEINDGPADAGMTFLGQFVDHDVTLDAQSAIGTRIDPRSIRNIRTPNLDLDCVYGDGPEATPFLYSPDHEGFMLMGREDNPNDLPRNCKGRALIGDPRNDENIIVSQIQGAFIQLHNILMSHVEEEDDTAKDVHDCAAMGIRSEIWSEVVAPKLMGFEQVRRFIRLHYQWIVLHEMLPAFVDQKIIDHVLAHDPFPNAPIMPAEFSGAAYRFGHATVQPTYKLKKGGDPVHLFEMLGFSPRGTESDIEMRMFFDVAGTAAQKALPVGIEMADTLFQLPGNIVGGGLEWNGHEIPLEQARKLGLRNILRDRSALKLASGQQAAAKLGLDALAPPTALTDHHIDKTPLWFYCLQEASEKGKGRLTGVGGHIVASVIIRLLRLDPESVLNLHHFEPWHGFGGADCTMGRMMEYVETHRDHVTHREDLFCG
ncbi:peroxidase family protein [Litoreibacter roseus]|uniref:Ovoperoxidase n=1 Tax=Litoreibacter roseus TaxID=2601869 RepID=A0A6N6JKY4_9RHOB|nr:peroxidase family protein [Litoreibacter roseus]GFE66607.1 ovoperoxidase [Litoreibacter roseus]